MKIALYIIGGLIILMFGGIYYQNRKPQVKLGVNDGLFYELSDKDNCVSTQTSYQEKRVDTIPFDESLNASKERMKEAFEAYGGIEIKEETDRYIYAVATTKLMRFHDDIELYFDEEEQVIHYRSSSRAGSSDMGLNRQRYDRLVELYNME